MDEEVLLQESPLDKYLQSCGFHQDIVTPTASYTLESSTARKSVEPSAQAPESLIFTAALRLIYDSNVLLEEHHSHLKAVTTALYPKFNLDSPVQPLSAGWSDYLFYLIPERIQNLFRYRHAIEKSMKERLQYILDTVSGNFSLWKSCMRHCQETDLICRGVVIVSASKQRCSATESRTVAMKEAMFSTLNETVENLQTLYREQLQYPIGSEFLLFLDSAMCFSDFQFSASTDISELKMAFNKLTLLYSIVFHRLFIIVLSGFEQPIVSAVNSLQSSTGHWEMLHTLLTYHTTRLHDDATQRPITCRSISDKCLMLNSLFLHSRELFLLTSEIENGNRDDISTDEIEILFNHLDASKMCLEVYQKCQASEHKKNELEKSFDDRTPADQEKTITSITDHIEPISDAVYIGTENDELELEVGSTCGYDDDKSKLTRDYSRFVMKELRGVITQLAKETEERENKLLQLQHQQGSKCTGTHRNAVLSDGQMTVVELSEFTKSLIENRDIKSMIANNAAQINSDDEEGTESAAVLRRNQAESQDQPEVEEDTPRLYGHSADLSSLAAIIASHRLTNQSADEECFISSDISESDSE